LLEGGHREHIAIKQLQGMLDSGVTLESLFGLVFSCQFPSMTLETPPSWMPAGWNTALGEFYTVSGVAEFWDNTHNARAWQEARTQANNIFDDVKFKEFLKLFFDDVPQELVFMPNIGYPADFEVGFSTPTQLISVVPPQLAWGESAPWPFDEETNITHSYRGALAQYMRLLLKDYLSKHTDKVAEASQKDLPITDALKSKYPTWEEQFTALFISGGVAIYLEDYFSKRESQAFALMEKRARGMDILPATISVMRRYMKERGNKFQSLADFLTVFPTQLRVAKKIVMM